MAKGSNLFQNAYRKGTRQVLRLGTLWHAVAALQTILVCGLAVMKLSFTGTLKHDTPATIGYITLIRGYCIEVYRSIYIYMHVFLELKGMEFCRLKNNNLSASALGDGQQAHVARGLGQGSTGRAWPAV